jgi:hypothetical protein
MANFLNLARFFKSKEKPYSYKRFHYLNQLPKKRMEEILLFSEGDHLAPLIPSFERKRVLFFNDLNHKYIFKKILAQEPAHLVNYVYRGEVSEQRAGYQTILGDMDQLAVRKNHFDIVVCPFVLEKFEFVENFMRTIADTIDNGARVLISVAHPQFENIVYNQNPASSQVANSSLAKYYALLKECHLYTEELCEGEVDLALKTFFTDSENDYYHEYKNTPMSLLFKTVKFVKKPAVVHKIKVAV